MKNERGSFSKRVFVTFLYLLMTITFLSFQVTYFINLFCDFHFIVYFVIIGITIVLDIVLAILINLGFDRGNSFAWFLYDHSFSIFLGFCFLSFFFSNMRKEPALTVDHAIDLIEIEWTVYAITVTVFVVWRKLVFDKIYNAENEIEDDTEDDSTKDEKAIIESLEKRNRQRRKYIFSFEPVAYLVIDLFLIIVATISCFRLTEYDAFQEALVFFAAFSCMYSLSILVLEIALDLFFKRSTLVNKTKVKPSRFNDFKEMKAVRAFLENLDNIDNNITTLKDYKSGSKKTDACIARCHQLLLEYRQDKKTAFENKKELLLLSRQLPELLKKTNNAHQRKLRKLEKEMAKIEKIMGNKDD